MRRKSLLLGVVVLLLLAGTAACLGALARHVPRFYAKATMPPGKDRKLRSAQFLQDFNQFCEDVRASRTWRGHFEQDCLNSFFQEQFIESGLHQRLLPDGIREPRISFQNDRIRFGFRYGAEPFSAVISIDM